MEYRAIKGGRTTRYLFQQKLKRVARQILWDKTGIFFLTSTYYCEMQGPSGILKCGKKFNLSIDRSLFRIV